MTLAPVLMVQGTASSAGKSMVVAGLLRILKDSGIRAAPFKAQNMALNSFVTKDGFEIGRAQAVQAAAAGILPTVHMNPILLKPEGNMRSQIVILGRPTSSLSPAEYYSRREDHLAVVGASLTKLRREYDFVVIEGAGSPAEINLRRSDIANMATADLADARVILVASIELGGVFAAIAGTVALLSREHRDRLMGCIINKFRGDEAILAPGIVEIEERTGLSILGILPHIPDLRIAEEDSLGLEPRMNRRRAGPGEVEIAVIRLPRISNFDDLAPLENESGVVVRFIDCPDELHGADLAVLPGTKTTVLDLAWLRERGFADALARRVAGGEPILGICGGCQILGREILDPEAVESPIASIRGLALLPIVTRFESMKTTAQVRARAKRDTLLASMKDESELTAYEIHSGAIVHDEAESAIFELARENAPGVTVFDGAASPDGAVTGTLLHGIFENPSVRMHLINRLRERKGIATAGSGNARDAQEQSFDKLADVMRKTLDLDTIFSAMKVAVVAR